MPTFSTFVFVLGLAISLSACRQPAEAAMPTPPAEPETTRVSPVVVELFTSEGCSSCPPADRLLAELAAEHGEHVIALAYHVDYWDRLGWADPFGDAAYSERQRAYARRSDGRVYTPQMIVGGTRGFVGSNRTQATTAIDDAHALAVELSLTARADDNEVAVTVGPLDVPEGAVLHLALVQKATQTDVPRGENRGRRLEHVRVVRQLDTLAPTAGTYPLSLPGGLRADDVRVVALVQDGPVGRILGAAETRVTGCSTRDSPPDTRHHVL